MDGGTKNLISGTFPAQKSGNYMSELGFTKGAKQTPALVSNWGECKKTVYISRFYIVA